MSKSLVAPTMYVGIAAVAGALADRGMIISERTLRRWLRDRKLKGFKPGGCTSPVRVSIEEIEKLVRGEVA
ncbi:hypothetical protein [Kaistia sp. UC242_56]|uniref:hypothetical protein n=1 Tax=Kaistia sp. UC242_56 TaxID=3374625 RepID=UPI00378CD843